MFIIFIWKIKLFQNKTRNRKLGKKYRLIKRFLDKFFFTFENSIKYKCNDLSKKLIKSTFDVISYSSIS